MVEVAYCTNREVQTESIEGQEVAVVSKSDVIYKNPQKSEFDWVDELASKRELIQPDPKELYKGLKVFVDEEGKYIQD